MTAFRPGFWPTVFTLLCLAVLLGLGAWQLQRLEWKEALIAQTGERLAQPPGTLPESFPQPQDLAYLPIAVEGRYLHDRELYFASRVRDGQVGLHVVTPFALADGRQILIDRGWVPPDRRDPASRAAGQIGGQVRIEGLLRSGGWSGFAAFAPANDPQANLWLWPDLPAMAAAAGLENPVTEVYLDAAAGQHVGDYPIGGQTQVTFKNDHLQYALTWFGLAAVLAVIYLIYGLRRRS
ncbi:MAG: SURF1 family protein [Rhodovibrionaceae bacterium]